MPSITEPLDFVPSARALDAALDELDDAGSSSGGAVDADIRRRALHAYTTFGPEPDPLPRGWRHRYDALPMRGVEWSTGRLRVPATSMPPTTVRPHEGDGDRPALAVATAGGLVHLASTYLEPQTPSGERRFVLTSLADARRRFAARVDAVHGAIVPYAADRFTALATAFQNCGAYVDVPAGLALDDPIQLVWTTRPGATNAVFPQTVVRVGAGARATIYERHLGQRETFVAGTVEVDLAPGAHLDYVVVQDADESARVLMHRGARVAAGATIGWHVADLGAALARTVLNADLVGARAACEVHALFFARAFQNVDVAVRAHHAADDTTSRLVARNAAAERARGRFRGDIAIEPHVAGVDAALREAGLLLSRDAALDVTPALEIAANRVAAFHAATIGSLDEEHLFYVQSRGISRRTAERMMALAFCEPAIAGFPGEPLRDEVRTLLDLRLDDVPETFAS